VNFGALGDVDDIGIRGVDAAVADVVRDGVVEEGGVLGDYPDCAAEGFEGDGADVLAIDEDASGFNVVEAEEEAEDGGFAISRS
jgi:hypothetical protein